MLTILAHMPFVVLFVSLVLIKIPAIYAAPFTLALTLIGAITVWQVETMWISASFVKALLITLDIAFIIFGALFLLHILERARVFTLVDTIIARISPDKRVQAILIGWFFVAFIEGLAGFGTPAVLAAPLLVALGFSPIAAVVIALLGDTVAVTFGAVGIPITIGIAEGIDGSYFATIPNLLSDIAIHVSLIHLSIGFLIPLFISCMVSFIHNGSLRRGFEAAPFALFSGFAFLVPFVLAALFLPPEFPSIIASLVGGFFTLLIARKNIFDSETTYDF